MTVATIKPALYVACRDCAKDTLSADLKDLRCLDCQVRRACADVRAEIVAFFKKQRRYAVSGATANEEQLHRLHRRLLTRILALVSDPRKAAELLQREYKAAERDTPIKRLMVDREEVAQLHPDVGRLQVLRP